MGGNVLLLEVSYVGGNVLVLEVCKWEIMYLC